MVTVTGWTRSSMVTFRPSSGSSLAMLWKYRLSSNSRYSGRDVLLMKG